MTDALSMRSHHAPRSGYAHLSRAACAALRPSLAYPSVRAKYPKTPSQSPYIRSICWTQLPVTGTVIGSGRWPISVSTSSSIRCISASVIPSPLANARQTLYVASAKSRAFLAASADCCALAKDCSQPCSWSQSSLISISVLMVSISEIVSMNGSSASFRSPILSPKSVMLAPKSSAMVLLSSAVT